MMADYLRDQGEIREAAVEYLQALRLADSTVVAEDKSKALGEAYEPLIEASKQNENEAEIELLCDNIRHLLVRPNWRAGVGEARSQLPRAINGAAPLPLADILTQANSGRLVDAMTRINRVAREGYLRAAMEEAFTALEFAPHYLPLHISMGELMLMQEHPELASAKFGAVARLYSARGESERATQMYKRIVDISPLDTQARLHLIDQVTGHGDMEEAISQYLELADVLYRLAQLDGARETYEKALRLAQSTDLDSTWTAQILQQMADIDLQRFDWRKALRVYEQLRTLVPDDETARLNLVKLNMRLGQETKAVAELDNYLSFLSSRSRDDDARNFLRALVEEMPELVLGRRRLAEHHQQMGDRDEAIEHWNKVGELLVEAGDREGAKVAVRAILSLNPPNADRYREFLQRLNN
jgi:tetratricopeptide (TPR) repeat protein